MKIFIKIKLIFCLVCMLQLSFAQKILTLEEAMANALKNNYDIQLLRNDSTLNDLNMRYTKYGFLPKINASTSIGFNNNNQKQKFSDGTEKERNGIKSNNLNGAVQLNWTLFDGYKMFATRAKVNEYFNLGNLNIKSQIVATVADIANNYYNIIYQKQQLKAILDQMSINEERVKIANQKLNVGLGAKPELLQAKVDLNAQKSNKIVQQNTIEKLKEQLNQLMAIPLNSVYDVTDSIRINNDIILTDILNKANSNNLDLIITKKNIDIAKLTLKEKKADKYPVISFNSAYNYSKLDNKDVVSQYSPLYNRNNGINYGLGLSFPILNGYAVKKQIKQSELAIDRLNIFYKSQVSTINLGITNSFKDYQNQKKILQLEEENIILAKENVTIALERFRLGVSTYLELRETQKSLEDANNRLLAARYNTKVAEINLLMLKGELVK